MPEITGIIKAKSQYGVKMTDDGDWWNWSKPEYRGQPFDTAVVAGDRVHVEYAEADNGKTYISVIAKVGGAPPLEDRPQFPPPEQMRQDVADAVGATWGFEQKDRLMCRESCIKSAVGIYTACIQAGLDKTPPASKEIVAYAAALEAWCLEAVEPVPDEIPFE